jgi:hypothetical protein
MTVVLACIFAIVLVGAATAGAATRAAKAPATEPAMQTRGDGVEVNAVAPFHHMWVAVGSDSKGDASELAIWTAQGTPPGKWSRVPDDAFDGDLAVSLDADSSGITTNTVLAGVYGSADDGAVAVGTAVQTSSEGGSSQTVPIAVTSDDGVSWHVVAMENAPDVNGTPEGVTFQNGRFVAGGYQAPADGSDSGDRPAVWYSDDGATWSDADGLSDSVTTAGLIEGVARSGGSSPVYVAVGSSTDTDGEQHGAVWTSDDGAAWTREPEQAAFGSGKQYLQRMISVIGLNKGFMAVGAESKNGSTNAGIAFITPDHLVVWRSTDGLNWTRNKRDDPQFASGDKARPSVTPAGVDAGAGYHVIVGRAEKAENKDTSPRVRAWSSTDGVHWDALKFGAGTDAVTGEARAVSTAGKYYEVVGVLGKDGNVWDGMD